MSNLIKTGKKCFTVGVAVATIMWSIGVFAFPVAFAATSGDLIKIKCTGQNSTICQAVYYLGTNGKRYVFPNEKTYKTWYADFSSVKEISQTEMESYPIGGNATYRPGIKMAKITTDPKVYAISKGGTLQWVKTEAIATALYGATWNKQIDDVPDYFFTNYTLGSDIADATAYDKTAVTAGSTSINVDKSLTGGGPTTGGSSLTIALASDTPASGLVLGSAARVPFTTITLTASSDGDVVVDSLTVERGSLAQDGAFSSLDVLDAATGLPLNNLSKTLSSDHRAVFSDDITVAAGTTKKVILAANMTSGALSSYAGEVPTLGVVEVVLKGGATVVGLPVVGNYQTVNGTLTVGTSAVTVGANDPAAATKEVGTKDYIVSSIKISNNSTATNQDFKVKSVRFTQNGSAGTDDVQDVRLMNANTSVEVGKVAAPTSKKVDFTNLDIIVKKGDTLTFDLRLTIKNGSARTISYDVDQQADIAIYDMLRGQNVLSSYTNSGGTAVSSSPYYNANNTTIGNGKLRVESMAITSTNIPENTKKVLLGKYKFVVEGEQMNITSLGFTITTTTPATGGTGAFTNVYAKEGDTTLTSPVTPSANTGATTLHLTATSTDTVSLKVGEHEVSLYGDLDSNFTAGDTVRTGISPEAITVRGDISGNLITPTPSPLVQSTQLTVKAAALAVSLDTIPAAQTVVAGTQDFVFGSFILDATQSGSDVRVSQFALPVRTTGSSAPSDVSGIEIFDGAAKIATGSSNQTCSLATCSTTGTNLSTTTVTISVGNLTILKGTVKVITVRGDIGTANTSGTFATHSAANLTAIDENANSVTPTYTDAAGGTMTLAAGGTLQISVATDPQSANIVANTTIDGGKFLAKSKFETIQLKGFGFRLENPDGGIVGDQDEVDTLELWEQGGSSAIGTITVNAATATITPATPIEIAMNVEKTYIVKVKWTGLANNTAASSGGGVRVQLTYIDSVGVASGASSNAASITTNGIAANSSSCASGGCFNTFSGFKSLPTFTKGTVTNKITGNTVVLDLAKFDIKADSAGPIGLAKLTFAVATTTIGLNPSAFYLYESTASNSQGTKLADTGDFQIVSDQTVVGATLIVDARFDVNNDDSNNRNTAGKTEALIVSAGTSRYFTFQGTTRVGHDGTASNESIAVYLAGDAAFAGTGAGGLPVGNNDNSATTGIDGAIRHDDFIWSDLNFDQYSSSSATKTLGWFNGYRVPGLEQTTTTLPTVTDQ